MRASTRLRPSWTRASCADAAPQGSDVRFSMLETIREYATERLEDGGDADEWRRRHAHHFLALAEEADPRLMTDEAPVWLARLEHEHDNLRSALAWTEAAGASELELRLAIALADFWRLRGHMGEGRAWLESALSRSSEVPPALRAKAHEPLGSARSSAGRPRARQVLPGGSVGCLPRHRGRPGRRAYALEPGRRRGPRRRVRTCNGALRGDHPAVPRRRRRCGAHDHAVEPRFDGQSKRRPRARKGSSARRAWPLPEGGRQGSDLCLSPQPRASRAWTARARRRRRDASPRASSSAVELGYTEVIAYCLEACAELAAAQGRTGSEALVSSGPEQRSSSP